MNKLKYITYQTFPSNKANSIQTIENLNYLRNYFDVELIFPLREKLSSTDQEELKKYYDYADKIIFSGEKHNLPFGKIKIFEKYLFLISHYFWAKNICKKYKDSSTNFYFTRSDWVFYFISKYGHNIIFECHQLSKIRKWVMKKSLKSENAKIIFLNKYLLMDSGLEIEGDNKKVTVLQNGADNNIFKQKSTCMNKKLIFSGSMTRFNEKRNLDFLVNSFKSEQLSEFNLEIIGGSEKDIKSLKDKVIELNIKNIKVKSRISKKDLASSLLESEFGLLINSSDNLHSVRYTSPLKYFEFISMGLKVLAVDFPAHRALPYQENIYYFKENDKYEFIRALKLASESNFNDVSLPKISLENRAKKIYDFFQ